MLGEGDGGKHVVQGLKAAGVTTVFTIPASHIIEVCDALSQHEDMRTVVARNEQAAVFMADGYARRSRLPGVAVVTGGPGLTNAATGLHTAYADSSPVVVVSSDLDEQMRTRHPVGTPHELYDAASLVSGTGSTVTRVDSIEGAVESVAAAVRNTTVGRPRPATVLVARDVLETKAPLPHAPSNASRVRSLDSTVLEARVEALHDLIATAQDPLLVAGTGVVRGDAERGLEHYLNLTGLPSVTTVPGSCAVANDHPTFVGRLDSDRVRSRMARADLVIALGTSFGSATTNHWGTTLSGKLCHIDVDSTEFGRHYSPHLTIQCDALTFIETSLRLGAPRTSARVEDAQQSTNPWIEAIDEAVPRQGVTLAVDVCTATRWVPKSMSFGPERHMMLPWNAMTMGWAVPAAIGAAVAAPDDTTLAVIGDGGLLFCIGELATIVQERIPLVIVVFNNCAYGLIAELQDEVCEGRRFGVDLTTPDFVQTASSFGLSAVCVQQPAELRKALEEAVAARRPMLIEVRLDMAEFATSSDSGQKEETP